MLNAMGNESEPSTDQLKRIATALERIADLLEKREAIVDADLDSTSDRTSEPPDWLTEKNITDLANELLAFVDREQSAEKTWIDRGVVSEFWNAKGLESRYDLPEKHQRWLDKVESLVEKMREARETEELRREEAAIPNLVSSCSRWASERELKRLSQADVEAILKVDVPKVRPSTVRTVWQQVNLHLKGGA